MQILKRGKNKSNPLINKIWKKKCDKCGCKFKFDFYDTYIGESVLGVYNYYVNCPQCEKPHYVSNVL